MENNLKKEAGENPSAKDLLPGGMSRIGFLSEGQTLDRVLSRDTKALAILGYSIDEVASLLDPVCNLESPQGSDYVASNGKKYRVTTVAYRGWQNCPWKDVNIPLNSGKDIKIRREDGGSITIPGMLPHLIREHKFFEGGDYRLAPEDIVEIFGTERGTDSIKKARQLPL